MNTQPEAHKRGYYGVVLVVGVALSVAGNALHASAVTDGSTLAAVGAAVFPVLLLMMTELTMLTAKRFAGWVRGVTAGLAAVVAVISFAISYEALAYAARELFGIGEMLSWLAPLTVDLPIIAATLALWAASDLIRRARAKDPVVGEPSTTGWLVDQPAAGVVADQPADHEGLATTTTGSVADPVVVVGDPGAAPQVNEVAVVESTSHDEAAITHVGDQPVVVESPTAVESTTPVVAVTTQSVVVDSTTTDSTIPAHDEPTTTVAEIIHAETGTTKPVEAVAAVLRLAESGESQRAIAAEVGVDRSLVRKWIAAADGHQKPALTAVR